MDYLNWGRKNNSTGKIAVATILGLAAGFAAGLLIAPRSGEETRKILLSETRDALAKVGETLAESKEKVVEPGE